MPVADNTSDFPLVTVIAVCYNHEKYVVECLEHIRAQTYKNTELIIMDDCSKDNSVSIINDWIAKYSVACTFIAHTQNVGLCKTLNEALSHARGEYISMMATDDIWDPDKIERQMTVMLQQPETVAVVYSDTLQIDEVGKLLPNTFLEVQRPGFIPPSGCVFSMLIDRNFVHPLATIIRRNAITSVGGYDERLVVEDYDMWLRLAEKYDLVFCEGVFSKYRIVSSSMTRTVFINPTPNYSYGNYLICEKWLTSGLLSPAQYTSWVDKQMDATYWLYFHGDRRARKCLWKVFFRSRNLKVLLQATTCSLGITRPLVIKLTSIIFNRQSNDASARHEN